MGKVFTLIPARGIVLISVALAYDSVMGDNPLP